MTIRPLYLLPLLGFAAGWMLANLDSPSSRSLPAASGGDGVTTNPGAEVGDRAVHDSTSEAQAALPSPHQRKVESLQQAISHPSSFHRIGAIAPLLENLSAAQFAAMFKELSRDDSLRESGVLALFFRRWAQVDPEAALAAALKNDFHEVVLMAWGERDPDAALAKFEKLSFINGFFAAALRDDLRELAMPKPGQLPPAAAVKRIRELQGEGKATPAVMNSMSAIVRDWARTDPEAAWREVLALPPEGHGKETRDWALAALVQTRTGTDPDGALQWIKGLPESERGALEPDYVRALAWSGKTQQAREYALAMPEGAARRDAVSNLAGVLYGRDGEAAKAFVTALPDADWRDPSVFGDVFEKWLLSDPERATEVLLKRFPADAPAGPKQEQGYEKMFFFWSGRHPREASEFFLKLPESIGAKQLEAAVTSFTYDDPVAAGDWAAALPAGATRDKLLAQVAGEWTRRGVSDVTQWLDRLPQESGKPAAIEGFAKAVMSTSPDDALAWLRAVPNETDRLDRLRRVWRQWLDREAALRWVETSPALNDTERKALREISNAK